MKIFGTIRELVAVIFRKDSQEITVRPNQSTTYTAARDVQLPPLDSDEVLLGDSATQTVQNKTIDNTNSATLKDNSFTLQDGGDTTKQASFELAGISTATSRLYTFQDKNHTIADAQDLTDHIADTSTHGVTGDIVGTSDSQVLSNKELVDNNVLIQDQVDATKKFRFENSSIGTGTTRIYTAPNYDGELVLDSADQDLSNKKLLDDTVTFNDNADVTKRLLFTLGGATTSTTMSIQSSQTVDRTVTLPDASTTLVGQDTADTLTNKIIDGDDNTLQDIAISSLKADAANDDEFLYRSPTTGVVSSTSVNELTEKVASTGDDDFFLIWDSTAGAHRKITRENFPGGRGGYARNFMMDG